MAQIDVYEGDASPIAISDRIDVYEVDKETKSERRSNLFLKAVATITVEPALFLYMISSFLHFPVFQSLIYEKSCLNIFDQDHLFCGNDTATHKDQSIHSRANFVFTLSSICLTVPSFVSTIFLGSYGDRRSRKIAMLAPYVGLVMADVSYIVQATYMESSVYFLLLSDGLFGLFGGYSAIIGTSFSYGAQSSTKINRSYRMAIFEGCIGVGGTLGYLFSGLILKSAGYRSVFLINLVLHCASFVYICLRATDSPEQIRIRQRKRGGKCVGEVEEDESNKNRREISEQDEISRGNCWWFFNYFREAVSVLRKRSGDRRLVIVLLLAAFSVSFLVFSGSQDIMLYYLKHELNWSTAMYGIFRGVYFGTSSAMIFFLFPLLKYRGVSDWVLAAMGICSRLVGSLMLCFPFSTWFVFCVSAFYMFNRFAATGMRSIASKQVEKDEQGKLFAAIALIEAICGLLASVIFNNLFSWSLSFYAGFCYALMTALMIIPLLLIFVVGVRLRRSKKFLVKSSSETRTDGSETQETSDGGS